MGYEQPSLGGQLDAMWREGLKDLHNAIVPAFPESQHGVDELGTPLSPTQSMVNQELGHSYEAMLEQYGQPEVQGPEVEPPEMELGGD